MDATMAGQAPEEDEADLEARRLEDEALEVLGAVRVPGSFDSGDNDVAPFDADEGDVAQGRPDAAGKAKKGSGKAADIVVKSIDEIVEFFFAAGKKGIAINRYKGLGEMNPEQLWATTMDPEKRTLLQVRAEDHTEADLMFTTLMGDQVEPRRKFIEDNALDVKNLDI